jgi:hypothetical protein
LLTTIRPAILPQGRFPRPLGIADLTERWRARDCGSTGPPSCLRSPRRAKLPRQPGLEMAAPVPVRRAAIRLRSQRQLPRPEKHTAAVLPVSMWLRIERAPAGAAVGAELLMGCVLAQYSRTEDATGNLSVDRCRCCLFEAQKRGRSGWLRPKTIRPARGAWGDGDGRTLINAQVRCGFPGCNL